MWQVSGGHGPIDSASAVRDMSGYVDGGFGTWDLADHYGPAEDFAGAFRDAFRAERGVQAVAGVQFFTKWVPAPGPMPRYKVEEAMQRSLRRMRTQTLDLLQFHWWEYADLRYLNAIDELARLQKEGLIRQLGLTNFDTQHLAEIRERGVPVISNQVQYSLIDRRPRVRMAPYCAEEGVGLLAYGTLCGGLLSERYLGAREPSRSELNTVSLRKYKPMVDAWGEWALFQELLRVLAKVAGRHGVGMANVAVRYVLDQPAVAGVIVGARLGKVEHRRENTRVFGFALASEDTALIEGVLDRGRDLYSIVGDCGDEYRK